MSPSKGVTIIAVSFVTTTYSTLLGAFKTCSAHQRSVVIERSQNTYNTNTATCP
jgi:hypothetical protein